MNKIKLPTGFLFTEQYSKGELETLSIGDYGKAKNIKADFLGYSNELNGVPNGDIQPLQEKWVITLSTQYGCPMKCTFCLVPIVNTILMSDYTSKNIEDIEINDVVIANVDLKENENSISKYASTLTKLATVTGLHKRQYNDVVYTIITESGNKIVCTKEHPIALRSDYITRTKFESAEDLNVGDEIVSSLNINLQNHTNRDWMLGWLIGFMMGDGVFDINSNINRCMIAQNDISLLNYAKNVCDVFGIKSSKIWKNGQSNFRFAIQGKALDKLLQLECDSEYYHIGYIAGYWDAEGYSFSHNSQYRVCDSELNNIKIIESYLNGLGINSSIAINERGGNLKDMYILTAQLNRDKFNAIFTPLHKKMQYLSGKSSRQFSFFEKIISIETEHYNGLVYNIETSEHTYFSNGILNHNCDVPKVKFKGNATFQDLKDQLYNAFNCFPDVKYTDRLNIHFARMGEPSFNADVLAFTNWLSVAKQQIQEETGIRIEVIHPVFTTMLPKNKTTLERIGTWTTIKNNEFSGQAGLQFSINSTCDKQRDEMFDGQAMSLKEISDFAKTLPPPIGRKYCLNFAYASGNECDGEKLVKLFNPEYWMVKITPIHNNNACRENGIVTIDGYNHFYPYKEPEQSFKDAGFDVLIFIPSQDEEDGLITCGNAILGGSELKI